MQIAQQFIRMLVFLVVILKLGVFLQHCKEIAGHYLHQQAYITGFTAFEIGFYFKTQLQISRSPGNLIFVVFILKGCHYSGSRELMDKHRIRSAVHSLPHSQLMCTEPAQLNSPHEHTMTRSTLDVL